MSKANDKGNDKSIQRVDKSTKAINTIRSLLDKSKEQIAMALPKHLTTDRLLRIAITTVRRSPLLAECDPVSVVGAVMTSAQLGLEPDDVLGHAYLIPYWNGRRRCYEAQLQIGYRGLIELARRSGQVVSINAHVVHEQDQFDFAYGLEEKLVHRWDVRLEDRGPVIAFYAAAKLSDGSSHFEVMSVHEVYKLRDEILTRNGVRLEVDKGGVERALKQNKKTGQWYETDTPWVSHFVEMGRKTPIRRVAKFLPLSPEFQRAAVLDEHADVGLPQDLGAALLALPGADESTQTAAEAGTQSKAEALKERLKEQKNGQQRDEFSAGEPPSGDPSQPTEEELAEQAAGEAAPVQNDEPDPKRVSFGVQLATLRKERRVSQRALEEQSGLTSGSLSRIEHGKAAIPDEESVRALAGALGVAPHALLKLAGYGEQGPSLNKPDEQTDAAQTGDEPPANDAPPPEEPPPGHGGQDNLEF